MVKLTSLSLISFGAKRTNSEALEIRFLMEES